MRYSLYYHAVHLPYSHDDEDEGIEANKMTTQIKAAADFLNVRIGNIKYALTKEKGFITNITNKVITAGSILVLFGIITITPKPFIRLPYSAPFVPLAAS